MAGLRYLNTVLTVLCVLLTLNLYLHWSTGGDAVPAAHAQGIPDEGAQRAQMIDQMKLTNAKLDQLTALLTSGKVRVTVVNADDAGEAR
jgi:hypothetical protein